MADEPSLGELNRTVERMERQWAAELARVRAEHDADITRLEREHEAELQRLEREHARDVAALRNELKEVRERPQLTAGRLAVLGTAVTALLALVVQAYGVLKGAK